MIILDRAEDLAVPDSGELLEFFLGGASVTPLPFLTSFVEFDDAARSVEPINFHGVSNGVTPVTIMEPPAGDGLTRQLKSLSVYNPNTADTTVTIELNDNATLRVILSIVLSLGDTLQYNDGEGFRVLDSTGNIKVVSPEVPVITAILVQSNPAATTLTDAYTVPAGFRFEGYVNVANRSVATAFRISIAIAGAADSPEQYIAYDTPLTQNNIYNSGDIKANGGDVIRVYATLATLSFSIIGELKA
jgi:hypothetical protein